MKRDHVTELVNISGTRSSRSLHSSTGRPGLGSPDADDNAWSLLGDHGDLGNHSGTALLALEEDEDEGDDAFEGDDDDADAEDDEDAESEDDDEFEDDEDDEFEDDDEDFLDDDAEEEVEDDAELDDDDDDL